MDVKTAVQLAKTYVGDLFSNEGLSNLGLEEVEFEESRRVWNVTLGFSRPWDRSPNALAAFAQGSPLRSYKVVRIDDASARVISVKNRENES